MQQHVTTETDRAIAAGDKNHKQAMEMASEVNKSVDNMKQEMTNNHNEAMTASGNNESLLNELSEKSTDLAKQVENHAVDTICANQEQHEETRTEVKNLIQSRLGKTWSDDMPYQEKKTFFKTVVAMTYVICATLGMNTLQL